MIKKEYLFYQYNKHKDAFCILFIILFIIFANILILTNLFNTNPINHRSGLAYNFQNSILPGEHTIDPNDGFTSQALGNRAADEIIKGDMPLWNEYEGIGFPLAAEMQSAALFPLTILHNFSNGILYIHLLLEIIAAVATYLFLRKLNVRRAGAITGGIIFGISGTFVWLTNAALNPVAFLPVLMLGIEYIYNNTIKNKAGGWVLFALALALSIYSGFPETVYLYAILPLGWAILRFTDTPKNLKNKYTFKVIIGGFVGILLATPIIILFGTYLMDAYAGAHGAGLATYSLPGYAIPSFFMPYMYGPIFGVISTVKDSAIINIWGNVGGFVGIGVIILALFAYKTNKIANKYILFLLIVSIVYLLRLYGFEPLVHLLNYIPGMNLLAVYRYATPALIFALIVLAVLGIDGLINFCKSKKFNLIFLLIYLVLGIFLFYASTLVIELNTRATKVFFIASALLALAIITLLYLNKYINLRWQYYFICTLLVMEAYILYVIPQFSTDFKKEIDLGSVRYLQDNIGFDRFYTLGPIEPNYGSYFEIASINNNDLPVPKNWADYITNKLNTNTDPILFTGTFMSDPNGPTPKQELFRNIENYKYIGMKYIVTKVTEPFSSEELIDNNLKLVHKDNVAIVYSVKDTSPYFEIIDGSCSINAKNKTNIIINCENEATLIRKELYMKGWYTNLGDTKPYGDYGILQSIKVPAGETELFYKYSPPYLNIAYVLFTFGALIIAVSLLKNRFLKK